MASYFLDSSAIVKRYLTEVGSAWVRRLTDPTSGHDIYVVRVTAVEVVSALARHVPTLPQSDFTRALTDFRLDYSSQYQIVEVNETVVAGAIALAEAHRLRGYDAVQLAGALELQAVANSIGMAPLIFVSSDIRLTGAAVAEGLPVDNPLSHP